MFAFYVCISKKNCLGDGKGGPSTYFRQFGCGISSEVGPKNHYTQRKTLLLDSKKSSITKIEVIKNCVNKYKNFTHKLSFKVRMILFMKTSLWKLDFGTFYYMYS